ncbi:hypothetical protein COO60DRAFT_1644130 [Scenedesmus sp. NREL 46B-D3]|nr:hypothetical protein COO60DRAFT_1644130 [Scenedesmus sp. NREL 46B-D3]
MQVLHRQRASLVQLLQQQGQLEAEQVVPAAAARDAADITSSSQQHLCRRTSAVRQDPDHGRPDSAAAAARLDAVGVVADVPLLVMPAAAQQEVQQLLLPAMRQEVQAAQEQEQLQQQPNFGHHTAEDFARMSMAVEQGAWQHYRQMANDVYAVVQLSAAATAEAAAAAQEAAGVLGNAAADAAEDAQQVAAAEAGVMVVPHNDGGEAAPAAAGQAASPAAALQHLAEVLLFPLLLPFLATQGLHNLLRLLLMCLPQQLQLQWQQQQFARLQYLVAAAPAPLQLPALLDEQQQQQQQHQVQAGGDEGGVEHIGEQGAAAAAAAPGQAAAPAAGAAAGAERAQEQQPQEQQASSPPASPPIGGSEAETCSKSSSSSSTAEAGKGDNSEQGCKSEKHGTGEAAGVPAAEGKRATPAAAATGSAAGDAEGAARVAAAAEAAAAGVPWYLPFTQFGNGDLEQRYLSWKHHNLLQVDYLAALFEVLYLAVLLRRMMSEPVTLSYFLFILVKTLPHVPLMMGLRFPYLRFDACACGAQHPPALIPHPRHRELWLLLVAPVTAAVAICLSLPSVARGQPAMLLPNRAYRAYWASRGELQTSILRPFLQHMRVRPYLVYTLVDASICVWVFAQVFGVWAVVERWSLAVVLSIVLCWGLELYMRRRFVGALSRQHELPQQQQQQQLLAGRPHQD